MVLHFGQPERVQNANTSEVMESTYKWFFTQYNLNHAIMSHLFQTIFKASFPMLREVSGRKQASYFVWEIKSGNCPLFIQYVEWHYRLFQTEINHISKTKQTLQNKDQTTKQDIFCSPVRNNKKAGMSHPANHFIHLYHSEPEPSDSELEDSYKHSCFFGRTESNWLWHTLMEIIIAVLHIMKSDNVYPYGVFQDLCKLYVFMWYQTQWALVNK